MEKREGYKKTKIGWIPEEWDLKIIGDFTEKVIGGASLKPTDFTTDGFKVLPKKGIVSGGFLKINDNEQAYCSLDYASSNIGNIVDNKYLITTLRDLVPTGPSIGYIVKFNSAEQYILAQGVYGFKTSRELDRDFLIQFSNTKHYRKTMQTIMVGSTQVHIRNKDFLNVSIPYPPLPEQKKIASILTTVDDKISSIEEQIQQTEQLKKGLMEKLLTEGIGHTEFKDTKIGRIPRDWDVVRLGDLLSEKPEYGANASAVKYDKNKTYRYIRITDIDDSGNLNPNGRVGILKENNQSYVLKRYDLIIARTGNTVGKSYLYLNDDDDCAYAGYLIRFRLDSEKYNVFLLAHILHSPIFWGWVNSILRVGAQPNINAKEYQSFTIPSPSLSEQKQIASILSTVDNKIEVLTQKKDQYQTLKKGLSQQLLTGQMRVKI